MTAANAQWAAGLWGTPLNIGSRAIALNAKVTPDLEVSLLSRLLHLQVRGLAGTGTRL